MAEARLHGCVLLLRLPLVVATSVYNEAIIIGGRIVPRNASFKRRCLATADALCRSPSFFVLAF